MLTENDLNDLSNFNEIFGKDVAYDNIKSHKKPGVYPLSERCSFGKTTGGGGQMDPPSPSRLKVNPENCVDRRYIRI